MNTKDNSPSTPTWDTFNAGALTIEVDATAPQSPSNVLRATYPAGFSSSGISPGTLGLQYSGWQRFQYYCYYVKFSSNFQGHDSGINKMSYSWYSATAAPFVMEAEGSGANPLTPRPVLQSVVVGNGLYEPNLVPSVRFIRGNWHLVEVLLQGNTAGNTDGAFDLYHDGVHCTNATGIQWTSADTVWSTFEFQPVWGGTSGANVVADQYQQWDHVYLSKKT